MLEAGLVSLPVVEGLDVVEERDAQLGPPRPITRARRVRQSRRAAASHQRRLTNPRVEHDYRSQPGTRVPDLDSAYCFIVNAGDWWPRRSLITLAGTPARSAIVAWGWRSSRASGRSRSGTPCSPRWPRVADSPHRSEFSLASPCLQDADPGALATSRVRPTGKLPVTVLTTDRAPAPGRPSFADLVPD